MLVHHKGLAPERWYKYSLMEQLANIGTEVGRTINYRNDNRLEDAKLAFERALELIDLTVSDPKNRKRLKEILRVREALVDYFVYDNEYNTSDQLWNDYFYNYNYAAAIARGK